MVWARCLPLLIENEGRFGGAVTHCRLHRAVHQMPTEHAVFEYAIPNRQTALHSVQEIVPRAKQPAPHPGTMHKGGQFKTRFGWYQTPALPTVAHHCLTLSFL